MVKLLVSDVAWVVFLTFTLTASEGFQLQGPSGPLVAQLGGSVLLPCAAESPLPLEELEVEWRRADSGALLHLFQEGEERPESQDHVYAGRAHFFTEEVARGNYSIMLHNVTMQDAGNYTCKVFTNVESSNIIVEVYLERLWVSGGGVVFAHAADEVVLNCSVDSHIPADKLEEVTWRRKDKTLVLLYQDGEVVSESSDPKYQGRVQFYSEDISKGDLSLRLKDIRTEDKGEYICTAHSGDLSANTTVVLKALGFSNVHISILVLCTITLLYTLGYTILAWLLLRKKENSPTACLIHFSRFLCPDILLGICFILWGFAEGSLGEASACATLNFVRVLLLMKTAPYLDQLPGIFHKLKTLGAPAVYTMVTIVVLSVHYRSKQNLLEALSTMDLYAT
ncbi:butyrophilin-like protein 1 [Engraulis encrasicolus]|uniref:butyrophilin-like protein 1 n=1 Tax=Engraulis encrasicolus TaxID=184585 RepID=UPI002FD0C788